MAKVGFKISSRAAALIGRENVSRADGALIELVKNAYDADAEVCLVCINPASDEIIVYDTGEGMSAETILNSWMVIGTNSKKQHYVSAKGRIKSGEKGIGRFALDRLGAKCELVTLAVGHNPVRWCVEWSEFDESGKLLDEVRADLDEVDIEPLSCLPEDGIQAVENKLIRMGKDAEAPRKHGTFMRITSLRDSWTDAQMVQFRDAIDVLMPPGEQDDFGILFAGLDAGGFEDITRGASQDFDYRLSASFDGASFDIALERREFECSRIPDEFFEMERMKAFPYRRRDFETGVFHLNKSIAEIVGTSDPELAHAVEGVGPLEFSFTFMRRSMQSNQPSSAFSKVVGKQRRQWLDRYGGIKIYRDGFWVRPYGEPSSSQFDWLGLDARHAADPSGVARERWTVTSTQCQGTLKISRVANSVIADKSSREGVIDNEAFAVLKNVLLGLIGVLESDRSYIAKSIREYSALVDDEEAKREQGRKTAGEVLGPERKGEGARRSSAHDGGENVGAEVTENEKVLAAAVESYDKQVDDLLDELKLMRALATNGLITSSIAHDLKSERVKLTKLPPLLLDCLKSDELDEVRRGLGHIADSGRFLESWIDTLLAQLVRDRRRRGKRNLYNLVFDSIEHLRPVLEQKSIKVSVSGASDQPILVFDVDIASIVYNLVVNSIEAFARDGVSDKAIHLTVSDRAGNVVIGYSDTGAGLGSEYADPYEIMRFSVSSKRDNSGNVYGTGMGMYIIDATLRDYGARFDFIEYRNGFVVELIFPVSR